MFGLIGGFFIFLFFIFIFYKNIFSFSKFTEIYTWSPRCQAVGTFLQKFSRKICARTPQARPRPPGQARRTGRCLRSCSLVALRAARLRCCTAARVRRAAGLQGAACTPSCRGGQDLPLLHRCRGRGPRPPPTA